MNQTIDKTQAERLAETLSGLRQDVTKADRIAAVKKFDHAPETISRYLNGKSELIDNDTAVKLIKFFKSQIAKRDKVLG